MDIAADLTREVGTCRGLNSRADPGQFKRTNASAYICGYLCVSVLHLSYLYPPRKKAWNTDMHR